MSSTTEIVGWGEVILATLRGEMLTAAVFNLSGERLTASRPVHFLLRDGKTVFSLFAAVIAKGVPSEVRISDGYQVLCNRPFSTAEAVDITDTLTVTFPVSVYTTMEAPE